MYKDDSKAIVVKDLHKTFDLPHEKVTTVKSVVTEIFKPFQKNTVEKQKVLDGVSFEVPKGEFFGIVGRNGSGKSTLLKILAGIYAPSSGHVKTQGRIVPFIELGVGFNGQLSGRANIYLNGALLGFSRKEVDKKFDDIVGFAELEKYIDKKLKNYSSGMQVRLAFSVATRLAESDILLIDEVLAVGDADFQRKCFDYFKSLKKQNKTVVLVTHDMAAIVEFCDNAMLIEDGKVIASGRPRVVANQYSDLFLGDVTESVEGTGAAGRRGTHGLKYEEPAIDVSENEIIVKVDIIAKIDVEKVLYGIHVSSSDGTELTAVNNRLINVKDIVNVKSGETISVEWRIQNIFNDGKYFITLSLADPVSLTFDWYADAAIFRIKRKERSTTAILPPISVSVNRKGK